MAVMIPTLFRTSISALGTHRKAPSQLFVFVVLTHDRKGQAPESHLQVSALQ